jgi:hypothetical protein
MALVLLCQAPGVTDDVLRRAILDLGLEDEIRTLVGRWDDPEPRYADRDEAEQLLADARRYSSADEIAHDLARVYYVKVYTSAT